MGSWQGYVYAPRTYKKWRYPGVPIPRRLQDIYTVDGKPPRSRWR